MKAAPTDCIRVVAPHCFVLTFPLRVVFNRSVAASVRGRRRTAPNSRRFGPRSLTLERAKHFSEQEQGMTVSSQVSSRAATILVVEDDERARAGLVRAFESEGHRALACGDAAEALRELHRQGCDLVVLDIELPGVSGLALCRLLRAQAATRRLPVIVVSSHDREEYKVEAFAAGADDFVVRARPSANYSRASPHTSKLRRASVCSKAATESFRSSRTWAVASSTH